MKKDPEHTERPARRGRSALIGTPSLTGGAAETGMPVAPPPESGAERIGPRDEPPLAREPDLIEPRASRGDLLGRTG